MQATLLFFFVFCSTCAGAQVKPTTITGSQLPKRLSFTGRITHAVKWTDALGQHYALTTETGEVASKAKDEEDLRSAALYAYHYLVHGDSTRLLWRVYDYNNGCGLDLLLHFIDKAFALTDLDKNGTPEVWLMYKNSCQGDVSPVPAKIIMYEGTTRYALRGEMRVRVSAKEYAGGGFTLDDRFKKSHPLFRQFAEATWKKYRTETWQQ